HRRRRLESLPHIRHLPFHMEVRVWQVHDHKRHTVAYRVVSDVYTVTRLRVLDARLHGGTHFTSGRYGGLVSGGEAPSSPPPARRIEAALACGARGMTQLSPSTSASTPATSSARTITSTAAR